MCLGKEGTLERLTTEQVGLGKRFVKGSCVSGIIISRGRGTPADDFASTALSAAPDGPARPRAWEWAGRLTASKCLLPQQDVSRTHTSAEAAGVPAPGPLGQPGMSWAVWCRGGPESSEPGGPESWVLVSSGLVSLDLLSDIQASVQVDYPADFCVHL